MLTLKADADPGTNLRDEMLPEALALAKQAGARIEIVGNETKFVIRPDDTIEALFEAFDRLYPHSAYVSTTTTRPWPRGAYRFK
jgi:hypothetical protein